MERRTGTRIPVQMWVEERSQGGIYFQRAANLSPGGMFLEQTVPHPVGTVVEIEFTLPDDEKPIRVKAEIVNAAADDAGLGMGLKFVELDDATEKRIRDFVARQGGR